MKIVKERPIDELYMIELEDLAKFYECDIEFALKQAISIQHSNIKGFYKALAAKKWKDEENGYIRTKGE